MSKASDPTTSTRRGRRIKGAMYGSEFIKIPRIADEARSVVEHVARGRRCLVEVGFDHGRRLHSLAHLNSDWQILGLEVRQKRVEEAEQRRQRDQLDNLKVWRMDARTVFANVLKHRTVDVVDVLFPTPWWDPALREKRLLITLDFLQDIAKVLKPGGCLRIETDVESYADSISAELRQIEFKNVNAGQLTFALPCCNQLSRRQWRCKQDNLPTHHWTLGLGDAT